MNIYKVRSALGTRFRVRRTRAMVQALGLDDDAHVLDVGGSAHTWDLVEVRPHVTLLNIEPLGDDATLASNLTFVQADALTLPYDDDQFDSVVSNSVIEHVGGPDEQAMFADELRRVGRHLWVQAPARGFPIEPHYLAPFVHWMPASVQRRVVRWIGLWAWITKPPQACIDEMVDEIRLPTRSEMRRWFPDCEYRAERFMGLTKSHLMVRIR